MDKDLKARLEKEHGVELVQMALSKSWCAAPPKKGKFHGQGEVGFIGRNVSEIEAWLVANAASFRQKWEAQHERFLRTLPPVN